MNKSIVELNTVLKKNEYPLKGEFRNTFHLEVSQGLINDPNGLSYKNGEYNIFFQWNPYTCEHKYKHWGIVKTKDFIKYTKPQILLVPDSDIDKDGCYSGTAKYIEGKLHIFYTGNVKENGIRVPHQNIAVFNLEDKIEYKKNIIFNSPKGYTEHLRDPFYFYKNEEHFLLLGAQDKELKGTVLLYSSKDLNNWNLVGEVNTNLRDFGYMWECPNLFNLNGKDVLIISPQGLEKEEFKYQNLYQSGYIAGEYDLEKNILKHGNFEELDYGFDFYAPQILKEEDRVIMIGWLGMPEYNIENESPTLKDNYIYSLTIPRELRIINNRIKQSPIKEFQLLRDNLLLIETDKDYKNHEFKCDYRCIEINLDLEVFSDFNYILEFSGEKILLEYNFNENIFILNCTNLKKGKNRIRKVKITEKSLNKLQIFIDVSTIEIFINDGDKVMSSSFFVESNEINLKICSDKKFKLNSYNIWKLKGFIYE